MDLNEEIARMAYELYERDGRQDGKHEEHWLEAERIVRGTLAEQQVKTQAGKKETVIAEPKTMPTRQRKVAGQPVAARKTESKPRTDAAKKGAKQEKKPVGETTSKPKRITTKS
jgi:hypothetical protein